jgi:hypothetical protein
MAFDSGDDVCAPLHCGGLLLTVVVVVVCVRVVTRVCMEMHGNFAGNFAAPSGKIAGI